MECIGLWDIEDSEGYIYAAFKIRSKEGSSGDRKWRRICIRTCLDAFLPWNAASEGSILELLDAAPVIAVAEWNADREILTEETRRQ